MLGKGKPREHRRARQCRIQPLLFWAWLQSDKEASEEFTFKDDSWFMASWIRPRQTGMAIFSVLAPDLYVHENMRSFFTAHEALGESSFILVMKLWIVHSHELSRQDSTFSFGWRRGLEMYVNSLPSVHFGRLSLTQVKSWDTIWALWVLAKLHGRWC